MPDDDTSAGAYTLLAPVQQHASPERWAEIVSAAEALAEDDADDPLADLRYLDLLTPDEEDLAVGSVVGELAIDLRSSPTPAEITDRVIHLLENQFRCRVPAEATVIAIIGELAFDPANAAAGSFVTVEVAVETPTAVGRFQLTSPCETESQRILLSTPGNRLPVRIAARAPGRIALDLNAL